MKYAVVRVRGRTGIKPDIVRTLDLLSLTRINHCVIIDDSPQMKGMLQKCKDYVTWGEVNVETLAKLFEKRLRLPGNRRVDGNSLKEKGFDGFDALARAVYDGKAKLRELGFKHVIRLSPPRGGYKVIKQPYPRGALGYRGENINDLLRRMM